MRPSAAASLAILKVNWERRGKDYLDNFIPFVVSSIVGLPEDAVSLPDLQRRIESDHGLVLPLHALQTLLSRASKEGFVRREAGVFFRNQQACTAQGFMDLRASVEGGISRLTEALQAFGQKLGHALTREEAEGALVASVASDGLETLYANAEGRIISVPDRSEETSYVVAAFCAELQQSDARLFEDLLTLSKGHLLANALFLPELGKLGQKFVGTTVFLDTALLVYGCGFAGKDREAPARELIALLRQYGAGLACFRETVEEVRGILDSCASMIRTGNLQYAYGPSIEHFVGIGVLSTDIDLMSARVEAHIEALGVKIAERPAVERAYQIDELSLQTQLREEIRYKRERALVHDVDCISAILRLRRGGESNSVENCRALFVTTNASLARVAKLFFQPTVPPGTVAPCITANALANVLWLKGPTSAPNLPRTRVIAEAIAAMQPDENVWRLYLAEIARLQSIGDISADEYYLLRHAHTAKRALMDLTLGLPEAFSQGTVTEVLEIARQHLRADLDQQLAESREAIGLRDEKLQELSSSEETRLRKIESFASRVAALIASCVFAAILALLAVATLYTFPWQVPSPKWQWFKYALQGVQALLFLYTVVSIGWGTSLHGLVKHLERAVARRIATRISNYLGLPSTENANAA